MLTQVAKEPGCTLYTTPGESASSVHCYLASTPETRAICNDPGLLGVAYTDALRDASAAVLRLMKSSTQPFVLEERETTVLHILRGGLNFGLRHALNKAFGWNTHGSAFLSAQRKRNANNPEEWEIGEKDYRKIYLPAQASIVFGDVVATGTSLQYAVDCLMQHISESDVALRSVIFFTIGGARCEEILANLDEFCTKRFPEYQGTSVVYFEGRFAVPTPETALQIKLTGTDLVRLDSLMAPEFIASQSEDPAYPLERCAIYDAGSRAFWLHEYMEDVCEYWEQTLALARQGLSYAELLAERFPEAVQEGAEKIDLQALCERQINRFKQQQ